MTKSFKLFPTSLSLLIGIMLSQINMLNAAERNAQEVSIYRDNYGVAHIYAKTNYQVFFGYGYVVAQDRLFQLEMLKRTAKGQVAEVLGAEYVDYDSYIRTSYDRRNIQKQIDSLAKNKSELLHAYADGINHYLTKIHAQPELLMPKEYIDYDFSPSTWQAEDVAMLFVGSLANRYSDFNTEVDNLKFLRQQQEKHGLAQGWQIFSATKWLLDNNSPTTVPYKKSTLIHKDAVAPSYLKDLARAPSGSTHLVFNYENDDAPFVASSSRDKRLATLFEKAGVNGTPGFESASNLWMANAGKINNAKAAMINGPQFGWSTPSYVYGIGLHGGDYDVVGSTLYALPSLLFAHNNHIGWGATAGFGDQVDIFEEKLVKGKPDYYLHQGKEVAFKQWQEVIKVKNAKDITVTARRSVHGMVQSMMADENIAYTKQRAWEGKEVQSLLAWTELATKHTIDASKPLLAEIATNINMYIMDKSGSIYYRHGGHYPIRHHAIDTRLPIPGTGEYDWLGFQDSRYNPSTFNPATKHIVNWNNRPAINWPSPDFWWLSWYRSDRADVLIDELKSPEPISTQEFWKINERASFKDVNFAYFYPHMKSALENQLNDATEMKAWQLIKNWHGYWYDQDKNGFYDHPGAKIFDSFLQKLLTNVLADDIGEPFFSRFTPTGSPNNKSTSGINVQPGTKAIMRTIDQLADGKASFDFFNGKRVNEVFNSTFKQTVKALALADKNPDNWLAKPYPLVYSHKNFRGIPQTLKSATYTMQVGQNRGTENNLFIAHGDHIEAWDVYGPGQSGFIAPSGEKHKHHNDQLALYENFSLKKVAFHINKSANATKEVLQIKQ